MRSSSQEILRFCQAGHAVSCAPHFPRRNTQHAIRNTQRAFSLVELMVAIGLLAVIMVALMMAFQQVQRAMHMGINQVDVLENGRAIMNLISRDLQEITFSGVAGGTNFYVKPLTQPKKAFNLDFEFALDDLFFLLQTNNQFISIKYTLQQEHWQSNYPVAALYRKINPPPTTNYPPVTNVLCVTTSNVLDLTSPNGIYDTNFHRVADGIVLFRVQALNTNGEPYLPMDNNEIVIYTNVPLQKQLTIDPNFPTIPTPDYPYCSFANTNLPAFIEIELGIVEPQTLKAFDARLGVDVNVAKSFLNQRAGKVHLFRQRIPVRSHYRTEL